MHPHPSALLSRIGHFIRIGASTLGLFIYQSVAIGAAVTIIWLSGRFSEIW
jgi:hypothetical protein